MFQFIRNKISQTVESIKRTATHLLLNSVKKDRRWAIRALVWFGADCSVKFTPDHESILTYAIKHNEQLAVWLLNIPAIQKQAHLNNNAAIFALIPKVA